LAARGWINEHYTLAYIKHYKCEVKLSNISYATKYKQMKKLDGKYYDRVQLPAKVCAMVLLTCHFGI